MNVQEFAAQQIAASGGALSLLVLREGQVEHRVMVGEARPGAPIARDTVLLWLSSGKPITAAAIAVLYERGQIGLEDPVAKHLPEFAAQGKQAITIAHLLTHTAGLHRVLPSPWETSDWQTTIRRICAATLPLGFVPGEHAAYDGSASWFLLAEIIARRTGEAFESFVGREILEPARMRDAAFSYEDRHATELADRLAQYSSIGPDGARPLNWNAPPITRMPRPGASFRCTIDDMTSFYSALLDGRFLKPDTLALFTRSARGVRPDRTFGAPMDWGLGFMVKGDPRLPYSFAKTASPSSFGHGGQQTSIAYADPEQRRVVVAGYTTLPGERAHNQRMRELLAATEP